MQMNMLVRSQRVPLNNLLRTWYTSILHSVQKDPRTYMRIVVHLYAQPQWGECSYRKKLYQHNTGTYWCNVDLQISSRVYSLPIHEAQFTYNCT